MRVRGSRESRPLAQITAEAMKIPYGEIGIVDTVRFIDQYTAGYGDYTAQRKELFAGRTLDSIVSEIKQSRKRGYPVVGKNARHQKAISSKRGKRGPASGHGRSRR